MKKLLFLLLTSCCINAQVVIGNDVASNKNILKIKDGNKGVIFTNSNDFTLFPQYNAASSDLFNDLPNLEGSIIYNKTDDQYYKYDGFSWNPARQLQGRFNTNVSRLGLTNPFSNFCGDFSGVNACVNSGYSLTYGGSFPDNKDQLLVDNGYLGIKNAANGVVIVQNGLYEVGVSLGVSGGGLSAGVGLVEYRLGLQVSYDNGATYVDVAEKSNYSLMFVVDLNGTKTTSFTTTLSLPATARLRSIVNMKRIIASGGGLATYSASNDPVYSYLVVRQIKKY